MSEAAPSASVQRWSRLREITAVAVLTVTAVLTAWSGFESSKWGGEMSIAFSRASAQRIEAARWDGTAKAARGYDLQTFALYVEAVATGDDELATFVEQRFTTRSGPRSTSGSPPGRSRTRRRRRARSRSTPTSRPGPRRRPRPTRAPTGPSTTRCGTTSGATATR